LDRWEYFRRARKGLIAGLILPLLVVLGLVFGLKVGERFGLIQAFAFMLAGAFLGLTAGTLIVAWIINKLYPTKGGVKTSAKPESIERRKSV